MFPVPSTKSYILTEWVRQADLVLPVGNADIIVAGVPEAEKLWHQPLFQPTLPVSLRFRTDIILRCRVTPAEVSIACRCQSTFLLLGWARRRKLMFGPAFHVLMLALPKVLEKAKLGVARFTSRRFTDTQMFLPLPTLSQGGPITFPVFIPGVEVISADVAAYHVEAGNLAVEGASVSAAKVGVTEEFPLPQVVIAGITIADIEGTDIADTQIDVWQRADLRRQRATACAEYGIITLPTSLLVGDSMAAMAAAFCPNTFDTANPTTSNTIGLPPPDAPRRPAPHSEMPTPPPEPAALRARWNPTAVSSHTAPRHSPSRPTPIPAKRRRSSDDHRPERRRRVQLAVQAPPPYLIVAVTAQGGLSEATTRNRHHVPLTPLTKPGRLELTTQREGDWDFYRNGAACTGRRRSASLGVSCRLRGLPPARIHICAPRELSGLKTRHDLDHRARIAP